MRPKLKAPTVQPVLVQVQATAVPANASDPIYQRWVKAPIHFQLPAGGTHAQFRDPVQAWEANGTYYTAIGTQVSLLTGCRK